MRLMIFLLAFLFLGRAADADVIHNQTVTPGTSQEAAMLLRNAGSTLAGRARTASPGSAWVYRVVAPAGARLTVRLALAESPSMGESASRIGEAAAPMVSGDRLRVTASGFDGKSIPIRIQPADLGLTLYVTVPARTPPGDGVRLKLSPRGGPVAVTAVRIATRLSDRNGDGIADVTEALMGVRPNQRALPVARPPRPQTSFQTGLPYSPAIGVPTDAVLVYSANEEVIKSWLDKGYIVQTMGGFRSGPEYVKDHPDEVQRDAHGNPITIEGSSYMLPTEARNENSKQYYATALAAGSSAACPEEPEIWAREGYSEEFKREWRIRYGSDWVPPHSSVDARYKAEQLKAYLTRRQIESILTDVEKQKPAATRMVAIHSPVTYYQWGVTLPHFALLSLPALQEIIGQVWTGTARSAARTAGVRAERTFEVGYLEYSSLHHLVRGTNKRMWFLMDPVEDNPNRTQQDYETNYVQTLIASLLFPQVNSYEVMPWPQRIYGRVPPGYATIVNTVVGALADIWRYSDNVVDAGTTGIGSFVSDSMAFQREQPGQSDFDGFYGLTLPLVTHGIPVDVLQLDRVTEPGYLNRSMTLLLSYDLLKPASPEINRALAEWVRKGGSLIVAGGTDPYNDLSDSWWKQTGYPSPVEALFADLGIRAQRLPAPPPQILGQDLRTVFTGSEAARNLENRGMKTVDLTEFARQSGSALVRFEDLTPGDAWGAWLGSAELRFGGKLAASFRTGSDIESRFLAEERGTGFSGEARFADFGSYWVYRFDNLPRDQSVTLTLDLANGYLVRAGSARQRPPQLETTESSFDASVRRLRLLPAYPPTYLRPNESSTPLYRLEGAPSPVVWEARIGAGHVIYAGVPPAFFSATAQTSRWLRALTRRAHEKALGTYRERTYFLTRRGPYKAVRALGASYTAEGRYVNLLSPTLAVVEDPEIEPRKWAFWMDAGPFSGPPRTMAVSGRMRSRFEQPALTSFTVQAPSGTEGVARLYSGRKQIASARAHTLLGSPVAVRSYSDGETVLLRYANDADGVVVRVDWK